MNAVFELVFDDKRGGDLLDIEAQRRINDDEPMNGRGIQGHELSYIIVGVLATGGRTQGITKIQIDQDGGCHRGMTFKQIRRFLIDEHVFVIETQKIAVFVVGHAIFADMFAHTGEVPVRMCHSSCFEEFMKSGSHCLLLGAGVLIGGFIAGVSESIHRGIRGSRFFL